MEFNRTISSIEPSRSVVLMDLVRKMQETDPDVLNLTAGDPDFDTPEKITREAEKWLHAGYTHYTSSKGEPELRAAIAKKLAEENNAPYTPDDILVTPGGKLAVYITAACILDPGDEALWLTPGWVSYPAIVTAVGGTPKAVHLKYEENYRITCEALEAQTTEKTKLLIINYPNNPTGKILTESDLRELSEYLRKHPQVYVISDEMYEKVIYDGHQTVSIASDPEFFERVIIINGFSKSVAMTGWRIGYLACHGPLFQLLLKLFSQMMSCTSGFVQKAAVKAFECAEETEKMRCAYEERRDLIADAMSRIPGIDFQIPQGSFYAWLKIRTTMDPQKFAEKLLMEAKVAGVPGDAYGAEDGCYIRLSYAASNEIIAEACRRIETFMNTLEA